MEVTDRVIRLTPREKEVLTEILKGKTSKEAADSLYVSKRTVDCHLASAYRKLTVRNRVQALRRAGRLGLLSDEVQLPCAA